MVLETQRSTSARSQKDSAVPGLSKKFSGDVNINGEASAPGCVSVILPHLLPSTGGFVSHEGRDERGRVRSDSTPRGGVKELLKIMTRSRVADVAMGYGASTTEECGHAGAGSLAGTT